MNDARQTKMEALLRRARAGEHEALAELYEATYPELWRTVRTLVKNETDALDIVQDSYLKAFTHLDQLTNEASLLPWLRQIAANTARDHLRRKKPALFSELSDEESDQLTDIPDDRLTDLPENRLEQDETRRYLSEVLDALSDAQRLVVGLYYDQGLSIKTIASRLDLPQNTVKSQLRYSRQKIEQQVRALERQGVRLYGLSPILFFRMLLQNGSAAQPVPKTLRTLEGGLSRQGLQALAGEGSRRVLIAARHSSILRGLGLGLTCLVGAAGIIAGAALLRQSHGGDVRPSEPTDAIPHLEQQVLGEENAPKLPIELPAESTVPPETTTVENTSARYEAWQEAFLDLLAGTAQPGTMEEGHSFFAMPPAAFFRNSLAVGDGEAFWYLGDFNGDGEPELMMPFGLADENNMTIYARAEDGVTEYLGALGANNLLHTREPWRSGFSSRGVTLLYGPETGFVHYNEGTNVFYVEYLQFPGRSFWGFDDGLEGWSGADYRTLPAYGALSLPQEGSYTIQFETYSGGSAGFLEHWTLPDTGDEYFVIAGDYVTEEEYRTQEQALIQSLHWRSIDETKAPQLQDIPGGAVEGPLTSRALVERLGGFDDRPAWAQIKAELNGN